MPYVNNDRPEKESKKNKIGKMRYPVDNSQSFTIGDEANCPYLAGTWNTPPKKVLIVSAPYPLFIKEYGEVWEFVTVFYNNKCHVVLNCFSKHPNI